MSGFGGQASMLEAMAGQYAPLASGVPYQPATGFEGMPWGQTPFALFLQPMLANLMGRAGYAPMGLNDRNVYDVLRNQQFWKAQQELQRQIAEEDRGSWMRTMHGIANMTGTPWGADQMRAARGMTDAMVFASPALQMFFPEALDELAGSRGSAAVLAGRMMMADRYRMDPVTGRLGLDASQEAARVRGVFQDLYGPESRLSETQGFSAGQLGLLYEQLSSRGLIQGTSLTPRQLVAQRAGDPVIHQAMANAGITDPTRATVEQMDRVLGDSNVSDRLRAFDAERVKGSLKSYLQAVNAVRDIFGDMGRPNAPMSELIGALDALTNGSLGQIQPGRLNMMVRMSSQLADVTGLGMNNFLMMQQAAAQRGAALGLEPSFAPLATQHAAAYGAAVRAMGLPPTWGAMTPDQLTQLDQNLSLGAAASRAAQRAGVVTRLADRIGFAPGSNAALYAEALRTAADTGDETWIDASGNVRQMNLSRDDFYQVMGGSQLANGQRLSNGELDSMLNQRFANREFIQKYNLGDVIRRSQGRTDVQNWLSQQLQGFMTGEFLGAGVNPNVARGAATGEAARNAVQRIMALAPETFRNDAERQQAVTQILQETFGSTEAGRAALAQAGPGFFSTQAEGFYGFWGEVQRRSADFGYLGGSPQNMFIAFNKGAMATAARTRQEQQLTAQIRTAVSPLNRGSVMRRAMDYLQQVGADDPEKVAGLIATALGGVAIKDVRSNLMPTLQSVQADQKELEDLEKSAMAEEDPKKRAALLARFQSRLANLRSDVAKAQDAFGRMGVSDDMLSPEDTQLAINRENRLRGLEGQIKIDPNLSPEERRKKLAEFLASDSGKVYSRAVRDFGQGSEDVAYKLLNSKTSLDRFGAAGVDQAQKIIESNRTLLGLAASYSGGDVAALEQGAISATGDEYKDIMAKVAAAKQARSGALHEIQRMQGGGLSEADIARAAASMGMPLKDVRLASRLDEATIAVAERLKEMKPEDKRYGATREDLLLSFGRTNKLIDEKKLAALDALDEQIRKGESGPEKRDVGDLIIRRDALRHELATGVSLSGTSVDDIMRGMGVIERVRSRADSLAGGERVKPDEAGAELLKHYGLSTGDSEAERKAREDIGQLLKTAPGQAIGAQLRTSADYLSSLSSRVRGGDVVGDYEKAAGVKDEQQKADALQKFKEKYGLSKQEYLQFSEALHTQGEFAEFLGEGRTQRDPALYAQMLSQKIRHGEISPDGKPGVTEVTLKEGTRLTLDGHVTVDGKMSGQGEVNSGGVNHAQTGGH